MSSVISSGALARLTHSLRAAAAAPVPSFDLAKFRAALTDMDRVLAKPFRPAVRR
jgi:hypothetical protein